MSQILYHKFTEAGLGEAPFTFIGVFENVFKNGDGTTKAGGCCDYCFTGIRYEFHIVSSDGKKSKVGCDCIRKVNDHKLIEVSELAKKKLEKEKKRQAKHDAIQKELNRQRENNGGLTDYQVFEKKQQEQAEKERAAGLEKGAKYEEEVRRLRDFKGGFCDSVANDLELGRVPRGKGLNITLDILAKQCGRRNSPAYCMEIDRLEKLFQ